MVQREPFGRRREESEEERKRRLRLGNYSLNLSNRILTESGKHPATEEIPQAVLATFQKTSINDREKYWVEEEQKTGEKKNFGQQMVDWIEGIEGKPGLTDWVEEQEDPQVLVMLQKVGLQGRDAVLAKDFQRPDVQALVKIIDNDLHEVDEQLTREDITPQFVRSITFYMNYLNPAQENGDQTKELINTLFNTARELVGEDEDRILGVLEKITPLLQVAGIDAQYGLGALIKAKVDGIYAKDALAAADAKQKLTSDEDQALQSLQPKVEQHAPTGPPEVVQELQSLQPEPTPGHAYWIDADIPADFAEKLSAKDLMYLELKKPFRLDNGWLNKEVFDPAYALENDERFKQAELLTNNDSGIFALAAASAATPEKQAQLYKTLGEVILRVHLANPELLRQFLEVQNTKSSMFFAENDLKRAQDAGHREEEIYHKLLDPWQLVAVAPATEPLQEQVVLENQLPMVVDIQNTLPAWPERIQILAQVMQQDPLRLTPEQIRQIEFLGHSVDVAKVMHMLQGGEEMPSGIPKEPQPPASPTSAEAVIVAEAPERQFNLQQFFEALAPISNTIPRIDDLLPKGDGNPEHMKEFSTTGQDIHDFTIGNREDDEGRKHMTLFNEGHLNTNDFFLQQLSRENSALQQLLPEVGNNTLLAYVMEAAKTPEEQKELFKRLFSQVELLYREHPEFREEVNGQLKIERLFGNPDEMEKRLSELLAKTGLDQTLSDKDVQDIGFFALPFNLQTIADSMFAKYDRDNPFGPEEEPKADLKPTLSL